MTASKPTRFRVTATGVNPYAGQQDPWGGAEPPVLTYTWYSGDGDAALSEAIGAVQRLMHERGYTRFCVTEEPDD